MKKLKKEYKFNCQKCGKLYFLTLTLNEFKRGKYRKHCSRSCANSREQSQEIRLKKSIANKNSKKLKLSARISGLNRTHERKEYKFNCRKCGKLYKLLLTYNNFKKGKYRKHCSRSCANSRLWSLLDKLKKSLSAKNSEKVKKAAKINGINRIKPYGINRIKPPIIKICKNCGKLFETNNNRKQYCNSLCYYNYLRTPEGSLLCSKRIKKSYIDGNNYVAGGTTKWILINTSIGKFKVQGTYLVRMCKILDRMKLLNLIKDWLYTNDRIQYIAEDNKQHTYLLDFKIYNNDGSFKYIETKGYLKERDKYKWNEVRKKGFLLLVCFGLLIKLYLKKYNLLY